ncbi:Emopamil-binding protein [Delitschia confertaspora ATCC 74209]|uniref:Emopamil-binding protein n=1 Tax=Delitschia confertaspora ATCC 74209 TaxID=1513339 RepID=A0A9P4JEA5_9PLEO|nr:Emopamil-binding protein [Delitschia confertaspora ATCC 74209]
MSSDELEHALHPFYPVGAIIKDYAANTLSSPVILVYFSTLVAAFLLPAAYALTRARRGQGLPRQEFAVAMWFALCGYIHLAVEGYFVFNHATLAADPGLFGQMWKEYALSDSRYLTSDTFTVCMETVTTVLWGPLSLLAAYFIAIDHPARHPLQALISFGQIYGDILYLSTSFFDEAYRETAYSRPEPFYFYGYFIFLNAIWLVIPGLLLLQSTVATINAFAFLKAKGGVKGKKTN